VRSPMRSWHQFPSARAQPRSFGYGAVWGGEGGGQRGATRETPRAAGPHKAYATAQNIGLKDLENMENILQRKNISNFVSDEHENTTSPRGSWPRPRWLVRAMGQLRGGQDGMVGPRKKYDMGPISPMTEIQSNRMACLGREKVPSLGGGGNFSGGGYHE